MKIIESLPRFQKFQRKMCKLKIRAFLLFILLVIISLVVLLFSLLATDIIRTINCSESKEITMNSSFLSFGRLMKSQFPLAEDFVMLDHGAYGLAPKVTLSAVHSYQKRAESNIELWIKRTAESEMTKVRTALASLVSAPSADSIVMIPNVTSGMNAILRNLVFGTGDRILIFSTTYRSIKSLVQYIVDSSFTGNSRAQALSYLTFNITYPISNDQIVSNFEIFLNDNFDPKRPIRIAVLHHISSRPGSILPIERMIPLLKSRNVTVLVDGAHAIGHIPLNLTRLAPDYYLSDCHKWLFTARSSAMMYVDDKHKKSLHPALITSEIKRHDFQYEFFWQGMIDYSPYLSVIDALKFRRDLGGEEAINKYNHELVLRGGRFLAAQWNTQVLQEEDQTGNMIDVKLPLVNPNAPELWIPSFWADMFLDNYPNIYLPIHFHGGCWWVRLSAQIYNDMEDFAVADKVIQELCRRLNTKYYLRANSSRYS